MSQAKLDLRYTGKLLINYLTQNPIAENAVGFFMPEVLFCSSVKIIELF